MVQPNVYSPVVSGRAGSKHLNRFSQIVVNVSDLERSRAFYEAVTPLRTYAETHAPNQTFAGLGIESGEFDGYILHDATEGEPCSLHLVKWRSPAPVGPSYRVYTDLGFFRMCFKSPDVPSLYANALANGGQPFTEPLPAENDHLMGRPVFSLPDPDGVVLEFVTLPGTDRLYHVNCNVSDLEAACSFFQNVVGLTGHRRLASYEPTNHSFGPGGDLNTFEAAVFKARGGSTGLLDVLFTLDVVKWITPPPTGRPYDHQNNLGIARISCEVDDVEEIYEELGGSESTIAVAPPESWDYGPDLPERKVLIVRSPDGALVELVEQPEYPI